MPDVNKTLKQIIKRISDTHKFAQICIFIYLIHMTSKWTTNLIMRDIFKINSLVSIMFWKVSWITFNILQIPLWLYFWSMTKRFIVWLEVDSTHRNFKLFSLGFFYGLQILNNIGSGIISPAL